MKRQGMTLVEVLVSLLLFSISFVAVQTSVTYAQNETNRQHARTSFMAICYEIDEYLTAYGSSWSDNYFASETVSGTSADFTVYYDASFEPLPSSQSADSFYYLHSLTSTETATQGHLLVTPYYSSGSEVFSAIDYGSNRIGAAGV